MSDSYVFQAEINQLMSLIVNSFYSNKDIFLRELVSNASDAIDKHRHGVLTSGNSTNEEYYIKIVPDNENKILKIIDNGIGLTKQDMIDNLGTIAKSGTKAFMESLQNSDSNKQSLIGQFGVGFYSAFLVSTKVQVFSVKDGESNVWSSSANGKFDIESWSNPEHIEHGSQLVLHLKDDQHQYLEEHTVKELIKKHNMFITHSIQLEVSKTVEEEVPVEEPEKDESEKDGDTEEPDKSEKVTIEDVNESKSETKTKKVSKVVKEFETLNGEKPIWTKNPDDVTNDEYKSFYKAISNDWDEPLVYKHFSVEGQLEFKGILYIPKRAPFDLFDKPEGKKQNNIKLYVKKIFVTDDSEHLLPDWLSFVKGVVDSEDLPLNISREFLQQNRILKNIQKNLVKHCIDMIGDLSEEQSETFYKEFSKSVKLGAYQDTKQKDKLLNILKYCSVNSDTMITFKDYVDKMVDKQEDVYYICGENIRTLKNNSMLNVFKKNKIDVLLMDDPIDEYMLQQVREYKNDEKTHKLVNVAKDGLTLPGLESVNDEKLDKLCAYIKELLGDKVESVKQSNRVVDVPCTIKSSEHGWSANMERIMKAQALRNDNGMFGMMSKKVMEVNGEHSIIKSLVAQYDGTKLPKTSIDLVHLVYEVSLVTSGYSFEDPNDFAQKMYKIIDIGVNPDVDSDSEEVEVSVTEPKQNNETTEEESNQGEDMESVD